MAFARLTHVRPPTCGATTSRIGPAGSLTGVNDRSTGATGQRGPAGAGPAGPHLPAIALDPRPVVAAGLLASVVATIVVLVVDGTSSDALPTCLAALAIGALGALVFFVQRRGARSGRKGAQKGLS